MRRQARSSGCFFIDCVWFGSRASHQQIITLCNHPLHHVIRNAAIQYNTVPMRFVLMVSRQHRGICRPPEIPPFRVYLDIDPDLPLPLIGPGKGPFILPNPHQYPVGIMKRGIQIGIWQCQGIVEHFFSFFHYSPYLSRACF